MSGNKSSNYKFEKKLFNEINKLIPGQLSELKNLEHRIEKISSNPDFIGMIDNKLFFIGNILGDGNIWEELNSIGEVAHRIDSDAYLINDKGIYNGTYSINISSTSPMIILNNFEFKTMLTPKKLGSITMFSNTAGSSALNSAYLNIEAMLHGETHSGIIRPYQKCIDLAYIPVYKQVYESAKKSMGENFKLVGPPFEEVEGN